jgi:hypothetical protein
VGDSGNYFGLYKPTRVPKEQNSPNFDEQLSDFARPVAHLPSEMHQLKEKGIFLF